MSGKIVVVGTPIGNLGDMSPRAAAALTSADVVACEDTRRTGRLFQLLGLTAPRLVRLDDHAEAAEAPRLVARAAAGETVAVVSDAGNNCCFHVFFLILDPGSFFLGKRRTNMNRHIVTTRVFHAA